MLTRISEHRFTLLLAALLLLMLVSPTGRMLREGGHGIWGAVLITLLFSMVLLAAIPAVSQTRRTIAIAVLLVGSSIVLRTINVFIHHQALQFAYLLAGVLFLLFVVTAIARYLAGIGRVTLNTVSAALCIYMILGVLWANVYSLLELLQPGAFSVPARGHADIGLAGSVAERTIDLLYFSFTTLTTLGYGDITPASDFARMFAVTEALVGQVILVVLVARLVGLQVAHSIEEKQDDRKPE